MLNVLKRKPIVLIILPIVFFIEFFLRPFITNLSFDQLNAIYFQLSTKYYDKVLFNPYIIFFKSITAVILFCVMLRFLYKTIFFKNDQNRSLNNRLTKDFIKTFFVVTIISLVTFFIMLLVFIVFNNTPYGSIRIEYFQSKLIIFLDILIFKWVPALLSCFIISLSVYYIQNGLSLVNTFKKTLKTFQRKSVFVILLIAIISSLLSTAIRVYEDEMSHYYYDNKQTYNYGDINENFLDGLKKPSNGPVDEPENSLSSDVDINELIKEEIKELKEAGETEKYNRFDTAIWRVPLWIVGLETFIRSLFIAFIFIYSAIIASKSLESSINNSPDNDFSY